MSTPPIALPPLKLHKNKNYTYVFTYTGIWEPAVKDADGNVIKKGRSRSINRKTVGKIIGGGDTGVIYFYEDFIDSHPEIRDYTVIRNSDGTMTFTRISSKTADNQSDRDQISELIENHGYELDHDGRVIKSADGVPMGADPADIFESSFEAKRNVLRKKPLSDSIACLLRTKKAGSVLYLDHISFKTGVRTALAKTFKQRCKVKQKDALHYANYIETVVYNMIVSGENTYEGIPKFCAEHAVADCVSGTRTSFFKYINFIDEAFIDCFHRNFFEEYFKGNSERILNTGIIVAVDGSPLDHKNKDRMFVSMGRSKDGTFKNQLNVQFVCDADKYGLPIFYDLFDGSANDVSTFRSVMQKLASYNVSLCKICIVVDRGYPSDDNICTLLRNGHTFVFNCKKGEGTEVQKVINKAIADNIYGNNTFIELDSVSTRYAAYTMAYRYDEVPVQGKRASRRSTAELRYHVFFDSDIHHRAVKNLNGELCELTRSVKSGSKLTKRQKELLKKYSEYDVSKYVEGKPNNAPEYLPSKMEEGTRYDGFQVLLTNDLSLSSARVLDIYKSRPKVETSIQDIKQHIKGSTTKAKTDKGLQSKIFMQHLASIFRAAIRHDISDALASIGAKYSDMLRSTRTVLNNLDSIVVDQYSAGIVCKPILSKHADLLKQLGVPVPKSMLSLTRYGESCEVDPSISDEPSDDSDLLEH